MLRPSAPDGAPRAFCRRQNLDAGRIHCAAVRGSAAVRMRRTPCGCFARADKKLWAPRGMGHAAGNGAGGTGHACDIKSLFHVCRPFLLCSAFEYQSSLFHQFLQKFTQFIDCLFISFADILRNTGFDMSRQKFFVKPIQGRLDC